MSRVCVSMHMCVNVCMRVCVCVCVRVCVRMWMGMCVNGYVCGLFSISVGTRSYLRAVYVLLFY